MNRIISSIIAGFTLFLAAGIAGADELSDLEVTIRVVEHDDDLNEAEHELSLPNLTSDSAREHAEDDGHDGHDEHDGRDEHDERDEDQEGQEDQEDQEDREDREDEKDDHEEGEENHEEGESDDDSIPSP